jgi:2-oxoglutarate ferredoxin oxidoreductase subunit gamma
LIIRLVGFGGQGIVLSSYILGQAAIRDGKKALQNQSYGSESRGGECRGDVIISDDEIFELEPTTFDLLIAMSQPGYDKYISSLKPGGILIIDGDLVVADSESEPSDISKHGVCATSKASEKFGRPIIANMIMLGYLNATLKLVSQTALAGAIESSVPRGTKDLNSEAMKEGMKLAAESPESESSR